MQAEHPLEVRRVFRGVELYPCDRCRQQRSCVRVAALASIGEQSRGTVRLCADCLAVALEGLTDFGWSAQLKQWGQIREVMREVRNVDVESRRARAKRLEREALTRRRREKIDG